MDENPNLNYNMDLERAGRELVPVRRRRPWPPETGATESAGVGIDEDGNSAGDILFPAPSDRSGNDEQPKGHS